MKKFRRFFTEDTGCCVFYLVLYGLLPLLIIPCSRYCHRNQNEPTMHTFVSSPSTGSTSQQWSGNHLDKDIIDDVEPWDTVFICLGTGSKRFHSTLDCPGMQNCNSEADAITRKEAEDMGRTNCRRCYY